MQPIHETAYPVLAADISPAELKAAFSPTAAEIRFVRNQSRQVSTSVLILVQLKLLQRLGYFPMLADVPPSVIEHVRTALKVRRCRAARSHVTIRPAPAGATRSCCGPM